MTDACHIALIPASAIVMNDVCDESITTESLAAKIFDMQHLAVFSKPEIGLGFLRVQKQQSPRHQKRADLLQRIDYLALARSTICGAIVAR